MTVDDDSLMGMYTASQSDEGKNNQLIHKCGNKARCKRQYNGKYKCEACGQEFKGRINLLNHKRSKHVGLRYKCNHPKHVS